MLVNVLRVNFYLTNFGKVNILFLFFTEGICFQFETIL